MVSSSLNSVGGGAGGRSRQDTGTNLLQELEALSQALYKASQAQNVISGAPAGPSPRKDYQHHSHNEQQQQQQRQEPRSPGPLTRRGTMPARGSSDVFGKSMPYSVDSGNPPLPNPSSHPLRHSMSAAPSSSLYPEHEQDNSFQKPRKTRHSIGASRKTLSPLSAYAEDDTGEFEAPAAQPLPDRKLQAWHSQGFEKSVPDVGNFPDWLEDNINFSKKLESAPEKKKGFWNWKPFRSLSHIGHTRYNCLFSLHVHAIESLPQAMNGLRLTVDWRHKDRSVQTMPARAFQCSAEFEETLRLRCSVYSSKSAHHAVKFMPKEFVLCVIALDVDELLLGQHYLDLSRLLPEAPDHEQEDEDKPLSWTTSFKLSGKAKGATLVVTFGYELLTKERGDKSGRFGNSAGSQSPSMNSPSLRSFSGGGSYSTHGTPRPRPSDGSNMFLSPTVSEPGDYFDRMAMEHLNLDEGPQPEGTSGSTGFGERGRRGQHGAHTSRHHHHHKAPIPSFPHGESRLKASLGAGQLQQQQQQQVEPTLAPPTPRQTEKPSEPAAETSPSSTHDLSSSPSSSSFTQKYTGEKGDSDDEPDEFIVVDQGVEVGTLPENIQYSRHNLDDQDSGNLEDPAGTSRKSPVVPSSVERKSPVEGGSRSPSSLPNLERKSSLGGSIKSPIGLPSLERKSSLGSISKSPTASPNLDRKSSLGETTKSPTASPGGLERKSPLGGSSKSPDASLPLERRFSLGAISKSPEAPLGLERRFSLGSEIEPLEAPLSLERTSSSEKESFLTGSGKLPEVPLRLERKLSQEREPAVAATTPTSLDDKHLLHEKEQPADERVEGKDKLVVLEIVSEEEIQDKHSDSATSFEEQPELKVITIPKADKVEEQEDQFEDAVEEIRPWDPLGKVQIARKDPRLETDLFEKNVQTLSLQEEEEEEELVGKVESKYEDVDNVHDKNEQPQEFWDLSDITDQKLNGSAPEESEGAVGHETVIWETPSSPRSPPVDKTSTVESVSDVVGVESFPVHDVEINVVPDIVKDDLVVPEVVEVDLVPEVAEVVPDVVEGVPEEVEVRQRDEAEEMQGSSTASLFSGQLPPSTGLGLGSIEDHSHSSEMMDDLDNEVDLIAGDFLSMLEGGDKGGTVLGMSSDSENDSPRALLLRQFEQEAFLEGGLGVRLGAPEISELNLDSSPDRSDAQQRNESSSIDQSDASGPDWAGGEDVELASIMEAAESELQKATQTMRSKTRAKMLEDAETEALMQEWGLNERAFENSSPKPSAGFLDMLGNHMVKTPSDPPLLGQGLGPVVQTKDGGMLRSMNPAHFSQGRAGGNLVMQVSKPVVVPSEMGSSGLDIFRRLASAGVENMALQAMVAMPLEDITGKSVHQLAYESKAALEGPSSNQSYLSSNGGGDFNLAMSSTGGRAAASSTPRSSRSTSRGGFDSSSRAEASDEFVNLEELAPMAMQKMEALAMEGLKIQADMTDESAPYSVDALPWAGAQQNSRFARGNVGSLDGVAAMHLLDAKSLGDNVTVEADGLMSKAISIDEWMRLDAGQYDENDTTDETLAIMAAHGAVSKDVVARKSEDRVRYMKGAKASANFGKGGFMGNTLTIAILVQLRDPLRSNEAVGAPMMALVQAERVIVPPRPKLPRRAPSLLGNSISWDDEDEVPPPPSTTEEPQPQFKITAVHMSGLKPSEEQGKEPKTNKKEWGTQKQQQSGSRWLAANGMGKTNGSKLSALKGKSMGGSKGASEKSSESLWSVSSRVHGAGSKWKDFSAGSPSLRNPDVKFSSQKLRAR